MVTSLIRESFLVAAIVAASVGVCAADPPQRTAEPLGNKAAEGEAMRRPSLGFVVIADPPDSMRRAADDPSRANAVSLEETLRRIGFANPTIALAQEGVAAGEALRLEARALLLPHLAVGANYRAHSGTLQTGRGIVTSNNLDSLYFGAGAFANGSGTATIPGIRLFSHLGDAILQPRLAEIRVSSLQSDARAISQAVLGDAMNRYLEFVAAHSRIEAMRQTVSELDEIARVTHQFANAGQGRDGDARRAGAEALLVEAELRRLEGDRLAAAAELARLLNIDASTPIRPADDQPPILEWIDPNTPLELLIPEAANRRPELSARSAEIAYGQTRIRQETVRPWLPILSVGYSYGGFGGGGSGNAFSPYGSRNDFDVFAVWTLRNLGLGNRAEVQRARAETRQAEARYALALEVVRRQTAEALGDVRLRKQELTLAKARLANALDAYRQDLQRTRNLQGRPIEVLNSTALLAAARQDLIQAMIGFSQAQVQLLISLGRVPGAQRSPSRVE